jgi:hypothetical protein
MRRRLLLALIPVLAGCPARPARFADAPVVAVIGDDAPIPMPRPFEPVPQFRMSEAYLRRPLVSALDPTRIPAAGDVNALDDVPPSAWIGPARAELGCDPDDLPVLPVHPLLSAAGVTREGSIRVSDARGRFFELWRDPADRPEMSTGAAAATSYLLRALGYHVPGVWAADVAWSDVTVREPEDREALRALFKAGPPPVDGRYRVGLVRWPVGVDLGPTHAFDRRGDDRNDRVPHLDRRSLRALGPVFEWLGIDRIDAGVLRDAYLGAPGAGYVVHWVVDLGGALGADAVVRPEKPRDDDADLAGRNIWVTMGTFGVYAPPVVPTQQRWRSIGEYPAALGSRVFQTSPPFEPIDRLLPGDAYWIAKRIAALRPEVVALALEAARFSDPSAQARLGAILQARRLAVTARAFAAVTPAEVDRVEADRLVLRDEAVLRGFASGPTRYRVEIVDERGDAVTGPVEVVTSGARVSAALPKEAPAYVVVRATALRDGRPAPRPVEVHLARRGAAWRLVGVRH